MDKPQIDVIILSYAKNYYLKSLTESAIESLLLSAKNFSIKIIVVESNKELGNYQYKNTYTIYPNVKFGYNKFINIALKHTTAKYICVANNDLTFHRDWLNRAINVFNENQDLKSLSPICPTNHSKYQIEINTGIYKGYRTAIELAGWCILFKREILKFKPFDDNLKFWYCDNDYGKTLEKNNITHVLATSSIVEHLESVTLNSESSKKRSYLTTREFLYFDYKWNHKNWLKYIYRKLRFDYPKLRALIDSFLNLKQAI